MSKIAKRAKVSPATIYVYFENKEELLRKLYLKANKMSDNIFRGIDSETPVRVGFELVLRNAVDFDLKTTRMIFSFSNSFLTHHLFKTCVFQMRCGCSNQFSDLFERGKREQLLKQVDTMLLITYAYFPVVELVKQQIRGEIELNSEMLTSVIQMSWAAAKA